MDKLLTDFMSVMQYYDTERVVMTCEIPSSLYEPNPRNISLKLMEYASSDAETTSIARRMSERYYTSLYRVYHDLRLACAVVVMMNETNSPQYTFATEYYKTMAELLLREAHSLLQRKQVTSQEEIEELREKVAPSILPSILEDELSEDFVKVSTDFAVSNGEIWVVHTQSGPLFSSLTNRSGLDIRPPNPKTHFSTASVLPTLHTHDSIPTNPGYRLGHVESGVPFVPKVPSSPLIMDKYFHRNWATLPCGKWLPFSPYGSFAPRVDNERGVINVTEMVELLKTTNESISSFSSVDTKGEETGYVNVAVDVSVDSSKENGDTKQKPSTADSNGTVRSAEADGVEAEDGKSETTEDNEEFEEKKPDMKETTEKSEPLSEEQAEDSSVDLNNIMEWTNASFVDDDELAAAEAGPIALQRLLSEVLIQLQKSRRVRSQHADPLKARVPDDIETRLYYKAERLLSVLVEISDSAVFSELSKPSGLVPVLQSDYPGVLPAPPTVHSVAPTKKRGAYKKRQK